MWRLVAEGKVLPEGNLDGSYVELISRAFDRAAFKTPFKEEGRMEDFEKAIDDTLLAINTGVLRTRDNQILADIGFGKSSLADEGWRATMSEVELKLHGLRAAVATALAEGRLKCCNAYCYCGEAQTIDDLDRIRSEIIDAVNSVLVGGGFAALHNWLTTRR